MAKYAITDTLLNNLANSISTKTGEPTPMTLAEMKTAVDDLTFPTLQASKAYTVSASGSITISPDSSYDAMEEVALTVPAGTATSASTISGSSASISTGTNTITLSKSVSNTPRITTAGYISSGTAGNSSVSLTASVTTKGATTFHPSSTDQTISSGTYTTGTQTFKAVTTSNLTAANIKKDVVVKVGDSSDDDCVTSITGTYEGGGSGGDAVTFYSGQTPPSAGTGSNGDLYLQTDSTKTTGWQLIPDNLPNDGATRLGYYIAPGTPSTKMTAYIRCTPTVATGVTIDWGDGSTTTTTSTSATNYSHTYSTIPASGYYIQTIKCTSGTVSFVGNVSQSIWGVSTNTEKATAYNLARVRWAVIGSSCTSIGTYAFCRSYALEEVKIMDLSNITLGTYAFYCCYGLKKIHIPTKTSFTTLPTYCFGYCYALGELEIPSNITSIGDYVFYNCCNLKPIFKGSFTSIGTYAFEYCRSMLNITLSSNATFNQYALAYCIGLTTLTIPSTTTTINAYAMGYLYGLGELHFKGATPPTISGTTAWINLPTTCKIYVPTGKLSAYTGASNYPSSSTYTYVEE